MSVENANNFEDLDVTLPAVVPNDILSEGDDHLRLLKGVLKKVLPGITGNGFNAIITATEAQLNYLTGVTSNIQTQLATAGLGGFPVGGIVPYNGLIVNIPANYKLCDGANGTPNLIDKFIMGTNIDAQMLSTGGSADDIIPAHTHTSTHTHAGSTSTDGNHRHGFLIQTQQILSTARIQPSDDTPDVQILTTAGGDHLHSASMPPSSETTTAGGASAGIGTNIPNYIKLAFIMRVS